MGAGAWGTALALVLAKNHHEVYLWEFDRAHYDYMLEKRASKFLPDHHFPKNLIPQHDLSETMKAVNDVLVVVPSHVFEITLQSMKPHWRDEMCLAWATKGLIPPNDLASKGVDAILGKKTLKAVITGPTFANEVASEIPSAVLVASENKEFAKRWHAYLSNAYMHVEMGDDLVGAQISGVVKNVLAIAVGMSDGLGFGANTRAAIMTRGLQEMIHLGVVMGAKTETFITVGGVGDLILTCTDNQSRNRRFGLALGEGQSLEQAQKTVGLLVEGYHNTHALFVLSQQQKIRVPIIERMYEVLTGVLSPAEAIRSWWQA